MADAALVFGAGASEGIGGAVSRRTSAEGLVAFPFGRTPEKVERLAAQIRETGGEAVAIAGDCTDSDDIVRAFDGVEKHCGAPPRLVVYNAGNMVASPTLDLEQQVFESAWRVTALGAFLVGREAARRMLPAGGGTLIFTGATSSLRAKPPFMAFAAGKAAERSVAHGLAREFGPLGLHVAHVIVDGAVDGAQINDRMPAAKEHLGEDGMLSVDAIADAYWQLHVQDRRAWTLELDLRPYKEKF
jgi:NAD(P)-dependent dehydrogenase (short-subunit alcohol dehydrogenase family)